MAPGAAPSGAALSGAALSGGALSGAASTTVYDPRAPRLPG